MSINNALNDRVPAVDPELRPRDEARGVGQQEGDGARQVLRLAHAGHGGAADPLLLEVGALVEDLLGAATCVLETGFCSSRHRGGDLQRGAHVAGRDAVDPDVVGGPLDGQRGREVLDGRLGRVVRPGF